MEGEPASAKDRVLLTHSPHLVLDGADVAATVMGAAEVVCCVADHSGPAADALRAAIAERRGAGPPRIRYTLVRPPGRYVTGEESALVAWLNERPARPALRVDKSVPLRVGRRPVVVHNTETLSHIALIARHGARWFRGQGTAEAPGSTLVTVTGAVRSPGVLEVEVGTPVIDVLERAGLETAPAGVLVGGYGGSWLDPSRLATPLRSRSPGRRRCRPRCRCPRRPTGRRLRHRRDGPHRPLHGRGERRAVRPLRVRPAGHRRRTSNSCGPAGPMLRCSGAYWTARPRSTGGGRAVTPTAWSDWSGARWSSSPTTPGPMPEGDPVPGTWPRPCWPFRPGPPPRPTRTGRGHEPAPTGGRPGASRPGGLRRLRLLCGAPPRTHHASTSGAIPSSTGPRWTGHWWSWPPGRRPSARAVPYCSTRWPRPVELGTAGHPGPVETRAWCPRPCPWRLSRLRPWADRERREGQPGERSPRAASGLPSVGP